MQLSAEPDNRFGKCLPVWIFGYWTMSFLISLNHCFFWITIQINMETMEVVSLPGQLAACCADRQQLAYLIYYSTTVYHRNFALERQGFPQRVKPWVWSFPFQFVGDWFLLTQPTARCLFSGSKWFEHPWKALALTGGRIPLRSREAWRTRGKHIPIAEFVPHNELY